LSPCSSVTDGIILTKKKKKNVNFLKEINKTRLTIALRYATGRGIASIADSVHTWLKLVAVH
ncbi:hypothetical protein, partial [Citrobacter freundii]|uniref:hypothetical protein n=1 Tax=Citrobacter freundii TaxID=546 RepID=UPI002F96A47A